MERTCDNCLYFNTHSDIYPCKSCSHNYIDHFKEIPKNTNYDRLLKFPPEKLAKVIQCPKLLNCRVKCDKDGDCYKCKQKWLMKEGTI